MRLLVRHQACCPHALEHAGPHPLLKAIMYGAAGAQGAGQRLPLTARAQDVEDRLHCGAGGRASAGARQPVSGVRGGKRGSICTHNGSEIVQEPLATPSIVGLPLREPFYDATLETPGSSN